ncbi:MAG: hypothetical protein GXO73_10830, partial [Calditrichaeota bacterium]|nr:hypothetical protein [Calditrichota bacterium]
GKLLPWTPWTWALRYEMDWYLSCPADRSGYPVFLLTTAVDAHCRPRGNLITPAGQLGLGILSYLKYFRYTGKADPRVLELARLMGDYLVSEALTPDRGAYPRFTRSTGSGSLPLRRSGGGDARFGPNVIEPDKGGLAGYALFRLYQTTREDRYLQQALHNAEVLVRNMRKGDALHSPWPFRVDAVTGQAWGSAAAT